MKENHSALEIEMTLDVCKMKTLQIVDHYDHIVLLAIDECEDKKYVRHWCDTSGQISYYMLFQMSDQEIDDMFMGKIAMRDAYQKAAECYYMLESGGKVVQVDSAKFEEFEQYLPKPDVKFEVMVLGTPESELN